MCETFFSYFDVYSECPITHSTIRPTVHLTKVKKAVDHGSGAPPRAVSDIPVVKCTYFICIKHIPVTKTEKHCFESGGHVTFRTSGSVIICVDQGPILSISAVLGIRNRIRMFWASWIRIHQSEVQIQILPFSHKGVELTEIVLANKILTQNLCKKFNFQTEDNVLAGKQGCGSGSVLDPLSIGSLDPDPDPYSEYGSGSRRAKMTQKSRQ